MMRSCYLRCTVSGPLTPDVRRGENASPQITLDSMKSSLAKGILNLICCGLATCHSEPLQKTAPLAQPESQPATQEIILTRMPDPDLTDNEFNWAWAKVSENHTRYKPIRLDEFKVAGLRRSQCRVLGECFVIVSDQKVKDTSRHKLLVLYASDYRYKGRNYKPYWVTCNS